MSSPKPKQLAQVATAQELAFTPRYGLDHLQVAESEAKAIIDGIRRNIAFFVFMEGVDLYLIYTNSEYAYLLFAVGILALPALKILFDRMHLAEAQLHRIRTQIDLEIGEETQGTPLNSGFAQPALGEFEGKK